MSLAFEGSVFCHAPPLRVWKLLYDPVRFRGWWSGVRRSEPCPDGVNLYLEHGEGPFPMHIATATEASRVVIRCMATDDLYTWMLEQEGQGCRVRVRVEVAEDEAGRLRARHDGLLASLPRLAAAAERDADCPPAGP